MARFSGVELDAVGVIAETVRRCRAWASRLLLVYGLVFGPYLALYALGAFKASGIHGPNILVFLLSPLLDGVATAWLLDPGMTLGQALLKGLRLYPRLVATRLLKYLGIGMGMLALVIPGLLLGAWFSLSDPLIVVGRGGRDPFAPLFESRRLVRGHSEPVLLAMLPLILITQGGGLLPMVYGNVGQENADPEVWTHFFNIFVDWMYLAMTVMSVVLWERLGRDAEAPSPKRQKG